MQLKRIPFAFLFLLLGACTDSPVEPSNLDSDESTVSNAITPSEPVLSCDETLSAFEMQELWEMSNAKVHNGRNICFEGYVVSNQTSGDLAQGMIAFKPFEEGDKEIPAAFCQFTGKNGEAFKDYKIGDRIEIMGRVVCIDNVNHHNFMFVKCSLPIREVF